MPSRKLSQPGSNRSDRRKDSRNHRQFLDVFEDEPATDIPASSLAKVINAVARGNKGGPRNGSILWAKTLPPTVSGRTGYAAHTDGEYIVSDSGDIFSGKDVSYLWRWDDKSHDEIVEYISPTRVRRRDLDVNSGTGCALQGRPNLFEWHKTKRKWVVQLGEELYICNYHLTQWALVLQDSYWKIANSESDWREDGDYGIIANSRFIFRVRLDTTPPIAYPLNMPVLKEGIQSNDGGGEKASRYNFLLAVARLDGTDNFRHRLQDPPAHILTESGTVAIDENRKDWSTYNTDAPISNGSDRYGVLLGGPGMSTLMSDYDDVGDATIGLNVNNIGWVELSMDFRDATTLREMANIIQSTGQQYFASFTCEVVGTEGATRLRFTSGKVAGGDIWYVRPGVGGTDMATLLALTFAAGATRSRPQIGRPQVLRNCRLPVVPWTSDTLYQRWPTHYIVYRTPDYGPSGYHLDTLGERAANSPDQYIWNKDLRVCGSFIARRINGYIELRVGELGGEFELSDQGSVVEFEDASRVEIAHDGFVNSKLARYMSAGQDNYYYEETGWMAAHIGNGRVCRVTQTGDIVTVVPGSSLASFAGLSVDDERKPAWWPNGYRSYVRQRISATQWQVWDSMDRGETAFAVDPTYRSYCDTVNDTDLLDRSSGWTCRNRFMREVKASNVVSKQAAFVNFAARGQKEVRYCPLGPFYKQLVGYHNRDFQTILLEDKVMMLVDFTGRFSAICLASIHTAPTNASTDYTIPETYQQITMLPGMEQRADFGMLDQGSLHKVGKDTVRFVTNQHEVVDFNGWDYSGDLAISSTAEGELGRWVRALERAHPFFTSIYTRVTGWVVWWIRDRRLD